MMQNNANAPFKILWSLLMIIDANTEPTAIVEAKSKLDIFANVLRPKILVISIIIEKIAKTDAITRSAVSKLIKLNLFII